MRPVFTITPKISQNPPTLPIHSDSTFFTKEYSPIRTHLPHLDQATGVSAICPRVFPLAGESTTTYIYSVKRCPIYLTKVFEPYRVGYYLMDVIELLVKIKRCGGIVIFSLYLSAKCSLVFYKMYNLKGRWWCFQEHIILYMFYITRALHNEAPLQPLLIYSPP